jgi:hypothetical protein
MSIKYLSPLIAGSLLLSILLASTVTFADDGALPKAQFVGAIEYTFVGHLEQTDNNGRLLVWEASVEGDFSGEMKWWFVNPAPVSSKTYVGGEVTFYVARWELWIGEQLALAGESAGKTVFPDRSDGMWDGHGIVTEANGEFKALNGRRIYETGPVILGSNPPVSFSGSGMFQIF